MFKLSHKGRTSAPHDAVMRPAVVASDVGKIYRITGAALEGDRDARRKGSREVEALRSVTFVAAKGESIGIIGRNGSGKSTLLRMIAGGDAPTNGRILVASQPSLLGVSPALQGWLTGEQNAYLGLLALGMDPLEAKERVPETLEWAELGEASSRPMNTYSSGMGARLSFAISTAIRPEILLVDETLSTGDAAFADKAKDRMRELLGSSGNVFLVSHALSLVTETCSRLLWLHKGDLIADGEADEVAEQYKEFAGLIKDNKTAEAADLLARVRAQRRPISIYPFEE